MKQPKLPFSTLSKRRIDKSETKPEEPPAKKPRRKRRDVSDKISGESGELDKENVSPEKVFSDRMADCVKTQCQICRLPVGLTAMRSHTRSAHKMSIAQYKETHGNHRERIIQRIYHRCGLCQEAILLDSDDIAHHLKRSHDITHKEYNNRFMKLVKDSKPSEGGVKQTNKTRRTVEKRTTDPVERSETGYGECVSGPSTGVRLSAEEREANLCEVYRLQRRLLRDLCIDLEEDEEEEKRPVESGDSSA